MSNQQLIKSAHVWFLTALLACGLLVIVGKAGIRFQEQNSNQNSNSNSNTSNANSSQNQNRNANRSGNRNSGNMNSGNMNSGNMNSGNMNSGNMNAGNTNATGGQAGMAGLSSRDREFVMDAAMGGLMEVELGRIAAQQGMSDAVKQFGQRMVDDHTKANEELMTIASSKGITLPTSLEDKHRNDVTKLSGTSGAEFDRAYAKRMLRDHEKKLSNFEKESNRGTDPDLKAFAAKTIPTIQEHLQMARALPGNERGRGGNDNTNSGGSRNTNRNRNGNMNGNGNGNGNGNSNNSNRP